VVGRPVKWTSDRSEAFLSDAQGRDHITKVELALDADHNFTALRCTTYANMGAYLSTFAPCVPTWLHGTLLAGNYKTPLIFTNVKAVFTNTVPVDAYRGAGRPEATYQLERTIDKAARELGVDPVELRRKNFIPNQPSPTRRPWRSSTTPATTTPRWTRCWRCRLAGFAARKAESASRGKLRGIGFACYIEACGIAPSSWSARSARARALRGGARCA
jgi:carbon-monoxide dehydrogenase large subunit